MSVKSEWAELTDNSGSAAKASVEVYAAYTVEDGNVCRERGEFTVLYQRDGFVSKVQLITEAS